MQREISADAQKPMIDLALKKRQGLWPFALICLLAHAMVPCMLWSGK